MQSLSLLSLLLLLPLASCAATADSEKAVPSPVIPIAATQDVPKITEQDQMASALTEARLASLPAVQKAKWQAYLDRSEALHNAEVKQLEVEANGQKLVKAYAGKDFKLKTEWEGAWYGSDEAQQLTKTMLSFQSPTGGWSKAVDYTQGTRQQGMQWTSQTESFHYSATLDNRATTEQIAFLNRVYAVKPDPEVKKAIEKGLEFLFVAQYPNGGWPQTFPLEGGYHDAVTYNDNALVHVLYLLDAVATQPEWTWINDARKSKAKAASASGLEYVLKSQYNRNGVKTVWGAQHDPLTYLPVAARLKEPASLSGGESLELVRYLMSVPNQTPEVVSSIEAALAWYDKSKITDLAATKVEGKTRYVHQDAPQEPIWARFYDLKTNKPIFAGAQDGIIYNSYDEMAARNHFGYDFFVDKPRDLIKYTAKWKKKRLG